MDNAPLYDSQTLIQLARIALIALGVIVIPIAVIAWTAFKRSPVEKNPAYTFSRLFERAKALQMVTVILIVGAASFLALFRIIDSNGIVGILSGIAGYVLGGLHKDSGPSPKQKDESKSDQEKRSSEEKKKNDKRLNKNPGTAPMVSVPMPRADPEVSKMALPDEEEK